MSADASEVVPGSEYIIIAAPANAHPDLLKVRLTPSPGLPPAIVMPWPDCCCWA